MIKISIVIPIYNVEKYIGKCLESCLDQDLKANEYEIIVVNDKTPDNSMNIISQFQALYPNIKLINRIKNGGLSAARNTGLSEVKGEYVWFVDSDDWIASNCLKHLYHYAANNNLDVLCFGLNLAYPDGSLKPYSITNKCDCICYNGKDFISEVNVPPAAWAAIYRTDFLRQHKLIFKDGILHEDQEFTPRAHFLARRITYIDYSVYFYNQRDGSIMKSSRNLKRCRDLLTVADSLYTFAENHTQRWSKAYNAFMEKVYFCVTQSLAFYDSAAFPLSEYRRRRYFPMKASLCKTPLRQKLMLANLSPWIYTKIYRWLKN